jgi:predicted regulator of Ras-like GTPase activity (Roadblock/LC7/MglB family)
MSSKRDAILQSLAEYSYIECAALFSQEAELLNQQVGNWLDEDAVAILAGKMLCLMREVGCELERGEIEQIWLTGEQDYLIGVSCPPQGFLLVKANRRGLLGELRKVVELAARELKKTLAYEENFSLTPEDYTTINTFQLDSAVPEKSSVPESNNVNVTGTLRGRNFLEY